MDASSDVGFPRRHVELDLDAPPPRDWYAHDPRLSRLWEALSLLLPRGETFFVEALRRYRDAVRDPRLAAAVATFVGQEAMHGKGHREFNRHVADPALLARLDRQLAWILDTARAALGPEGRLAATCALEHFTALMAEQMLGSDELQAHIEPRVRHLWMWHALEELEHKSVAYDVYQAVGGGYPRRVAVMVLATVIFIAETLSVYTQLLASDRAIAGGWLRSFGFFWVRPGLFRKLVPGYLTYFRPGFHPSRRGDASLITRTRERLFGPGGPLADRTKEYWDAA